MSDARDETFRADLEWDTIPKMLRSSAESFGELVAISDGDFVLTYAELGRAVDRAAAAFVAAGLQPDDRAAVWAPNMGEWIVAALGLQSAGGVLIPLNTRFKGPEAAYVLERSGAKLLFTVTDFLDSNYVDLLQASHGGPAAGGPVSDLPALERIVVLRGATPDGCQSWTDFLAGGAGVAAATVDERVQQRTHEDLSDILFTSGTTGNPKGVLTTHGQSLRGYFVWSSVVGLTAGDRYLIVNPFFHGFGYKAGWLASLMMGATIYPLPVLDVPEVMRRVAAEQITVLPGPPALYQTILNHPEFDAGEMASLRLSVTGAAPTPVELINRIREELSFETIVTGYGLTESSAIATMCRHDDDPETIATTSGRAIPGTEVRIVDPDGAELARGEQGEIVVRGYNVMQGYLDDPDATAEAIDADGWLHTGDLGVMDERGYIDITGRLKDMFIVGGFNAYPAEIENLLLRHPAVGAAAVVGVPDDRLGEVGVAFVIQKPGQSVSGDELYEWSRENMANYKVPRRFEIVDEFPLNASGKVLKFVLQERAAATA